MLLGGGSSLGFIYGLLAYLKLPYFNPLRLPRISTLTDNGAGKGKVERSAQTIQMGIKQLIQHTLNILDLNERL